MQLADLDRNNIYTYNDYKTWDFPERVELLEGKIYEMFPAPNNNHQQICMNISFAIEQYLDDKPCQIFFAPFDVRLPQKGSDELSVFTVVQPDVCVICDAAKTADNNGCYGAPDIVVEVLSPGNSVKEMKRKYSLYERAGVLEYWVVQPYHMLVTIYTLVDGKFQSSLPLTIEDVITSPVLPAFVLPVTLVFKKVVIKD